MPSFCVCQSKHQTAIWKRIRCSSLVTCVAILVSVLGTAGSVGASELQSEDGYIRNTLATWVLGTKSIEATLGFEHSQLVLKSLKNKASGREMAPAKPVDLLSSEILGVEGKWTTSYEAGEATRLAQGELQLKLTFSRGPLQVIKTYVVYPGSSVLRSWTIVKNIGSAPVKVVEPHYFDLSGKLGADAETLDFNWMVGAHNEPGTWRLKPRKLTPEYPQHFDSYDNFPYMDGHRTGSDGVDVKITLNDKQVWPATGWQFCKGDSDERA